MSEGLEAALFRLIEEAPPGKSVDPAAVAKAVDPEGWRRLLPKVRGIAVGLARQGKLVILRHGKPASPDGLKGVYRLRGP